MVTNFYFRLASDNENDFILWSGRVSANGKQHTTGCDAVRTKLGVDKLPHHTLVVSEHELASGRWSHQRIREATLPERVTQKVKKVKAFEDVGMTFDQANDLLKKFGLK